MSGVSLEVSEDRSGLQTASPGLRLRAGADPTTPHQRFQGGTDPRPEIWTRELGRFPWKQDSRKRSGSSWWNRRLCPGCGSTDPLCSPARALQPLHLDPCVGESVYLSPAEYLGGVLRGPPFDPRAAFGASRDSDMNESESILFLCLWRRWGGGGVLPWISGFYVEKFFWFSHKLDVLDPQSLNCNIQITNPHLSR